MPYYGIERRAHRKNFAEARLTEVFRSPEQFADVIRQSWHTQIVLLDQVSADYDEECIELIVQDFRNKLTRTVQEHRRPAPIQPRSN